MLPEHLTNFGLQWLGLELAGVVLVLGGAAAIWSLLRPQLSRRSNPPFWVLVGEAAIAVPWLLFLILFPAALVGAFRPVLIAVQLTLVAFGLVAVTRGRGFGPVVSGALGMIRESWLNVAALIAVALFVVWGWLMPYPEAFQGHHHFLMSLVSDLWRTGDYEAIPGNGVAHEVLGTPPAFGFMLSLFSVPAIETIGSRPVFLLPGIFALITFQVMRDCLSALGGPKELAVMAFLLVAFSYYAAFDFTEISPDLFAPVMITLAVYHLARWIQHREIDWLPFVLLLAFAWIVRRQVFLLILAVVITVAAARLVRIGNLSRSVRSSGVGPAVATMGLMLAPVVAWTAFAVANYGSPLFPYESRSGAFGLLHFDELFAPDPSGHSRFLSSLFPAFIDEPGTMLKNALAGVSVSVFLTLAVIGFVVFGSRIASAPRPASLHRFGVALLVAFLLVLYLFFADYLKYPHYGAYLLAPFAALFLGWIASHAGRFRNAAITAVVAALLATGLGFWAFNNWGHAAPNRSLINARYLWPGYGTPLDRVAQSSVRTRSTLETEFAEYERALAETRERGEILYGEMEPGGLVPSLADGEYLGDVLFLDGEAAEPVVTANTVSELEAALDRLDVRFVYRPARSHGAIDDSLLLERLATARTDAEYLVPTSDLLRRRASG